MRGSRLVSTIPPSGITSAGISSFWPLAARDRNHGQLEPAVELEIEVELVADIASGPREDDHGGGGQQRDADRHGAREVERIREGGRGPLVDDAAVVRGVRDAGGGSDGVLALVPNRAREPDARQV